MAFAEVAGVRLYYELTGRTGDRMVLVHGSWTDHHGWDRIVPTLANSFQVLTYDRRGHSRSKRLSGQGSVREDVTDLAALLEAIGYYPAHIVGSSFGGSIVLRLAAERPDLFRSLTAHEPPLFGLLAEQRDVQEPLKIAQDRIAAVANLLSTGDMKGGARLFVETIAFGPGAWEELPSELQETLIFNAPTWLDEVNDPEALTLDVDRLGRFSGPVMLTVGGESAPFFPVVTQQLVRRLPQAEVRTFQAAGHVPHVSHPAEYVQNLTDFVRQV